MKNLFKLLYYYIVFIYYYIVFKSFLRQKEKELKKKFSTNKKAERERIKEEILYKQKVINKIKDNLRYNIYQSELDYFLKIEQNHKEQIRHLEAKIEVLKEELDEMQNKNIEQYRINEQFFFKLHNIEEREANIVKIEASHKILNSELADKLTINLK